MKSTATPSFLVDENLSKSVGFLKAHPEFVNVKDFMLPGIEDEKIIKRSLDEKLILVTRDKRLALDALADGVRVWYFDIDRKFDHKLTASHFS